MVQVLILLVVVDALENKCSKLKLKICSEFKTLICKVLRGHKPDYELILEEISLMEDGEYLDYALYQTMVEYYLNKKWLWTQS